ncbi:hypothetical protein BZG36_00178 [Bifiguratus adelaidae]|uniref:Myb-like domain-containing protein n=1 Tax=Bifiguratus adelaidae TaxID=1938954 RepID=A0A261Y8I3_9FUNG|nr:hypothetical protein BZG36_00178 [Bifiguratus adelaidae]
MTAKAQDYTPRSMTAGARNVLRSNDSASLWNCTLSPGWTEEESEILRKALMLFGVGNWAKIIESNCLPGKTNAQMNLQLQRLLGQQSTAEFAGLHIDPKVIGERNSKIQGPGIKRKNNTIVNTGAKLTREELKQRLLSNKEKYELPKEVWSAIELPKPKEPAKLIDSKRDELVKLQEELKEVQSGIAEIRRVHKSVAAIQLEEESSHSRTPSPARDSPVDLSDTVATPSSPASPFSIDAADSPLPLTDVANKENSLKRLSPTSSAKVSSKKQRTEDRNNADVA